MKKRNSDFILWSALGLATVSLVISLWTASTVSNLDQQLDDSRVTEIKQQIEQDLDELRLEIQKRALVE